MSEKINNPFAFPISTIDGYNQKGMTLRDYFAAKAMQSINFGSLSQYYLDHAKQSYEIADAMLKAREEK